MGLWQRILRRFRRVPDLFNLVVEPAYAIKASPSNPYFQAIERLARDSGFLGLFIVGAEGVLRPGQDPALPTRRACLMLDVYPNPAAVEGRSVADYARGQNPRRVPRASLVLEDESELFLWFEGKQARVSGAALGDAAAGGRDR